MKKSTKKALMALAIILIFGLSTIAFVATGIFGHGGQGSQGGITPLSGAIVDGPIGFDTEQAYVQAQFTFLRLYYTEMDELYDYASQLPEIMTAQTGQTQLIVNRLASEEKRAEIVNIAGTEGVDDLTRQGLFDALCRRLLYTPTDCLLANVTPGAQA